MAKRKASLSFACPGCQETFDHEIHVPFIGSCGHSLCAICVNVKPVVDCFVCDKKGSFTWKQKNDLAIELLAEKADVNEAKKSKMTMDKGTNSNCEPIPAILDPKNLPFLAQIVNQLNPKSFLTLSRSCKALHKYCFNSNDIKITHWIESMNVRERWHIEFYLTEVDSYGHRNMKHEVDDLYLPMDYSGYKAGFLSSAVGRQNLQKYPFVFSLEEIKFYSVRIKSTFYTSLRTFLAQFPIQKIYHLSTYTFMLKEWNSLLQFLKDFHVESVEICHDTRNDVVIGNERIEEAFTYLLQNFRSFELRGDIDERLLLIASVPKLVLKETSISKNTLLDLIRKLADFTDEVDWILRCQTPFDFDYLTLFSFNVITFYYNGPVPEDRPLLFIMDGEPQKCWLLRNDGKVLECRHCELWNRRNIQISMCPLSEYPPCLMSNEDCYIDVV